MSNPSNSRTDIRLTAGFLLGLFFLLIIAQVHRPGAPEGEQAEGGIQGEELAMLTSAPFAPPPISRSHATKVVVRLEVREVSGSLADGVGYNFWTYGGEVPGRFIRVREGDLVEFHLHNHPENARPHNIDLHALTGPGGGAVSSMTRPGYTSTFSFMALNPGLYVYHSATAPVPVHIAHGMYGLMLVEPKEGLPPVDREFYIVQGEFYTGGKFGEKGLQQFDLEKALAEQPGYVVFNGSAGSLTGENALKASTGETIRLYIGNAGPSLISSFRVIGEIFDAVYQEGGTQVTQRNVQTTLIPPGGAAIVDFKLEVPGTYLLVDNALFRAFNKGAFEVDGPENPLIFSGKQAEIPYSGTVPIKKVETVEKAAAPRVQGRQNNARSPRSFKISRAQMDRGKKVYLRACFVCHQPNGEGLPGVFPPLARADYLMEDKERSIRIILEGQSGEIIVNGNRYNGIMPPVLLNDNQVADVLTYVRNSWGNSGAPVTIEEVRRVRAEIAERGQTQTAVR
jgi:nitrite reductase (NO-forming)